MRPGTFQLERYFSRYEFSAKHLLSSSDCETMTMAELVGRADDECVALWQALRLGYTESPGLPLLRREIAGLYNGIEPDDVLEIVPEEGIFLAMNALLEAGDHVIVTHPGYQSLYSLAETIGCEVTYWPPDEQQGWRFDPAFVRRALRPTTKLIVANFPHNPTGYLPSGAEYDELLGLAADAGVYLFSDEMYRWLEQDAAARLPSAAERYGRAVSLCGLSKSFSLPGLRVGWLVTRDAGLLAEIATFKDFTTICGSAPSELLAVMGLRDREWIVSRNLKRIVANAARLDDLCAARPDLFSWVPPRAGSIALARLHTGGGALAFCQALADEAGVLLAPSGVFGYGDSHVRVGLGREGFADGLARLVGWLERRQKQGSGSFR